MKKDKTRKSPPGRPARSGAYSLMVRAGELPKRRTWLRAYLSELRADLIHDLGPREEDLTAAQRMILDRAISKLCVIRCLEEWVREEGVFKGNELTPVLARNYISYCESLRRDLITLGVDRRKIDEIRHPLEIAAEIDAAKANSGKEAGEEENASQTGEEAAQSR